jgi:hypothetical protein
MKLQVRLKVEQADRDDVYKDIVRIPERWRSVDNRRTLPEGSVCKITVAGARKAYAIVRGLRDREDQVIKVDERLRNLLGMKVGEEVELTLEEVALIGQLRWAWSASDVAYRVMARLAVLSIILGALGGALGLLSLVVGLLPGLLR